MKIAVLKFGGTSISTAEGREWAYRHVHETVSAGYNVTVVVSAMGRKGDTYATDTLLSLITPGHASERELDLIMSCGEVISSVVLSSYLNSMGLRTVPLTGAQAGIRTDGRHGNGTILGVDSSNLISYMMSDTVPIVTGFQGSTDLGEVVTLGRGGSDLTAIVLAASLNAERIELYKDVNGVMTLDPKVSPDARAIRRISARRLLEMVEKGSRLMHIEAVKVAQDRLISFKLRNNFSNEQGTLVIPGNEDIFEVVN